MVFYNYYFESKETGNMDNVLDYLLFIVKHLFFDVLSQMEILLKIFLIQEVNRKLRLLKELK